VTASAALTEAVAALARVPVLLVALDFDGVLAPIVAEPSLARPLPESVAALVALAGLPSTHVAVVSGRSLDDLEALSGLPQPIVLVGSHGAEYATGFEGVLTPERIALRAELERELSRLAAGIDGVLLECKPASVAVHVRNAAPAAGARLLAEVSSGPAAWPGVHPTAGKMVLELAVIEASKGQALDVLRDRFEAGAVFFAGDDLTDEKAFARLGPNDLGVKVGPGDTVARYRVDDPGDVTRLLRQLLTTR
jgi:trehalose 6-phosphate phosphatase